MPGEAPAGRYRKPAEQNRSRERLSGTRKPVAHPQRSADRLRESWRIEVGNLGATRLPVRRLAVDLSSLDVLERKARWRTVITAIELELDPVIANREVGRVVVSLALLVTAAVGPQHLRQVWCEWRPPPRRNAVQLIDSRCFS